MKRPIKRRNAQKSKKLILKCATELFSKKGYSRTSMDELATLCDLNKAMIFYYYDSKRGLYEAVIVEVLDEIYDTIIGENENHKTPSQELESFIKTYAMFASTHPYLPALLLKELSDSGSQIPETFFAHMKKLYMLFIDIMSRGVQKKCFNDVIPIIIYFMILGTLNLMVTTKPIRVKAQEVDEIDACATCDMDLISHYVFEKIEKMLKDK